MSNLDVNNPEYQEYKNELLKRTAILKKEYDENNSKMKEYLFLLITVIMKL